jgi:CRISPR-associated protein Cmr3
MGVDWKKFPEQEKDIAARIGKSADDAGKLGFIGPYIMKDGERLYPVPLHLLYSSKEEAWSKLLPAKEALQTDMVEKKRLPEVVAPIEGAKPVENSWLTQSEMLKVLQGGLPDGFIRENDLFERESRTGIGRDNNKRKTVDGMLYFTRHIRLKEGVSLAMEVKGANDIHPASMVRLGGEGRMASLEVSDMPDARRIEHGGGNGSFLMVLLTHGDFAGKADPGAYLSEEFELVSACTGKAVREGGWDYKNRKPKPLKSLVPAGSVYFFKGDASQLKKTHIGERTEFGYGEIAIGIWEDKK